MKKKLIFRNASIAFLLALCLLFAGCVTEPAAPADTTEPSTACTLPDGFVTFATSGDSSAGEPEPDLPQQPDEGGYENPDPQPDQTEPSQTQPEGTPPAASGFKVYFIDVGQADAALVVCDGKTLLIDGGNSADSNLMYAFLKNRNISHLDYVIATHAHEDHVGGLSGALNYASVGTVYSPVKSYSTQAFRNFVKAVQNQGKSITVPSVGHQFSLGNAICTVLAVNTTSDTNNSSIVLRITYGSTSFLFTGDAEREVEQALLNRGAPLRSTVLKVGHHGSYSSTSYAFLREVAPQYAIISCGAGNSYGHPHDQVVSRLYDADVWLFRTDLQGDIVCTSNGSSVSFSVDRNWNANVFGSLGGNVRPTEPETEAPTEPPTEPSTDTTAEPTTETVTEPEPSLPVESEPVTDDSEGIILPDDEF